MDEVEDDDCEELGPRRRRGELAKKLVAVGGAGGVGVGLGASRAKLALLLGLAEDENLSERPVFLDWCWDLVVAAGLAGNAVLAGVGAGDGDGEGLAPPGMK